MNCLKKLHIFAIPIVLALMVSAFMVTPALADDGTPPPIDTPTEVAPLPTDIPTEVIPPSTDLPTQETTPAVDPLPTAVPTMVMMKTLHTELWSAQVSPKTKID